MVALLLLFGRPSGHPLPSSRKNPLSLNEAGGSFVVATYNALCYNDRMSTESKLTDLIIAERVKGLSYYAIEKKHGIPAEEARELVREALSTEKMDDEWEKRGIAMLRIEKVIENLWDGVEQGSFKHAEVLFKGIEQLSQLLALNKQVMEETRAAITDEQAAMIYAVITENNKQMLAYINDKLKPNKRQLEQLEEWPQVSAEAATQAVEAVLYMEEEEDE